MINTQQGVAIADGLLACNDFCHHCRQPGLLIFNGKVDSRQRAHMVCCKCGKKEYRKVYQSK